MIKVGKVYINQKLNPNVFLVCILFSFIMLLVFGVNLISIFIKTKDYVKVESIVTNVGHHEVYSSDGDGSYGYADLEYYYKGTRYQYRKTLHIFIFYPKVKSKVNIYINPNFPTEVRDSWIVNIDILMTIFFLIFHIIMIKAYLFRRNINIHG